MFRRIGWGAAAVLAAGVLAVGCSDSDSNDVGAFLSGLPLDEYNASLLSDGNVGEDGRAMSNPGTEVSVEDTTEFMYFPNCENGTGILLYSGFDDESGQVLLNAHYFDGRLFHAPVQLRGDDQDEDSDINGFKLIWINTEGSQDQEITARNGDAVIVWSAPEEDVILGTNTTTEDDTTDAIYASYFDVSAVSAASAGGWVRGFQTEGIRIDQENIVTGAGDPSPSAFGFVSPGLRRTHLFTDTTDGVDSGDPTEEILAITYVEGEDNAVNQETRIFVVNVDLLDPTNDLAAIFESPVAISNNLTSNDFVYDFFVVHNQLLAHTVDVLEAGGGLFDTETHVHLFNETGLDSSATVGSTSTDNDTNDSTFLADSHSFLGPDEGTDAFYFLVTEDGYLPDNTPAAGDRDPDTDLFAVQIVDDDTLTVETLEIDNFPGGTITQVADSSKPTGGVANVNSIEARVNRTGEWMLVLFRQPNTDVNDIDTGTAGIDPPNVNQLLHGVAIQLRQLNSQGVGQDRDLDVSVTTVETAPSEVASGEAGVSTDADADVTDVEFQRELGSGWASSNQGVASGEPDRVGPRECAIQSNNLQMGATYTQFVSGSGSTTDDEERLLSNRWEFSPGATATDTPTLNSVETSVADAEIATRDDGYNDFDAVAFDAGDVERDTAGDPTGESGRLLVFFSLNRSNPTGDFNNTSGSNPVGLLFEPGLFVSDNNGTPELVSTDGVDDRDTYIGEMAGATVPLNENTDQAPHHAGSRIDIYWVESGASQQQGDTSQRQRLAARSYDKTDVETVTAVTQRFVPEAGTSGTSEDPVSIDNPHDAEIGNDDDSLAVNASATGAGTSGDFHVGVSGSTTEVVFVEGARFWAQENSGLAEWRTTQTGEADPILIDDDVQASVDTEVRDTLVIYNGCQCDNLEGAMVFFNRTFYDDDENINRVHVRVHD